MHRLTRARIRQHIQKLITDNVPSVKVYTSRPDALLFDELGSSPVCAIFYTGEQAEEEDTSPIRILYKLQMSIDILLMGKDKQNVDDIIDDIWFDIRKVLFNEDNWSEDIDTFILANTTPYTPDTKSEHIIQATKIILTIEYYEDKFSTITPDEFLSFTNEIKLSDTESSNDTVIIREE